MGVPPVPPTRALPAETKVEVATFQGKREALLMGVTVDNHCLTGTGGGPYAATSSRSIRQHATQKKVQPLSTVPVWYFVVMLTIENCRFRLCAKFLGRVGDRGGGGVKTIPILWLVTGGLLSGQYCSFWLCHCHRRGFARILGLELQL